MDMQKKIQLVEDLFYLFQKYTDVKQRKEIVIILLTEYHEILNTYFSDKVNKADFKKLEEQVKKNMILESVICGFQEDGEPIYESRYILVNRNQATDEQKKEKKKRIRLFNDTLILLEEAKKRKASDYKKLKEHFLTSFLEELKQAKNRWIIEYLAIKKEMHKRTRKNDEI